MSVNDLITFPGLRTVISLLNPETEDIDTPAEFDAATDDTIEAGDFILTVFGFWAIVNDVKVNSNGAVGYSTNMVFRSPEGRWIAPRTTYRRWIWQAEVLEVMS